MTDDGRVGGHLDENGEVAELVRRAQRGDMQAMGGLIREISPWIRRLCGSIALDRGDDAFQETMIVLLRKLPTLRDVDAFGGWVRTIAVREAYRQATGTRVTVPLEEVEPVAPDALSGCETAIDVRRVLADLSPRARTVLVLRHLEDLPEAEVARMLDVDLGTVKSRTSRARSHFTQRWRG